MAFTFDFSDLDTFDTAEVKAGAERQTYPCGRCGGTGFFQGVRIHEEREHCFACKGKGYFLTSPQQREANRAKAAERKAKKELQMREKFVKSLHALLGDEGAEWFMHESYINGFYGNLRDAGMKYGALTEKQEACAVRGWEQAQAAEFKFDLFKAEHPEVVSWLERNTGDFAVSLLSAAKKYGQLTERQLAAVLRIIEADKAKVTIDLTRIHELFNTARASGLKRMAIKFDDLRLSPAPAHGNNAGCIYVKVDGEYAGKLTTEGKFFGLRSAPEGVEGKLIELAKDPRAALTAHGHQTGECACCGRQLTNQASIDLGIGPICAEKWGVA